jgi:DNA repair exonuclease SbcCD ATPase subunit
MEQPTVGVTEEEDMKNGNTENEGVCKEPPTKKRCRYPPSTLQILRQRVSGLETRFDERSMDVTGDKQDEHQDDIRKLQQNIWTLQEGFKKQQQDIKKLQDQWERQQTDMAELKTGFKDLKDALEEGFRGLKPKET